jgi:hypothetical protein
MNASPLGGAVSAIPRSHPVPKPTLTAKSEVKIVNLQLRNRRSTLRHEFSLGTGDFDD